MAESPKDFRMLVIDDDDLNRSFIGSVCEAKGWMMEEVNNGLQGIEMVKNNPDDYDIVLLDIRMPGLSGLEVLPELLKYGQDLGVIMMSGFAEVNGAVEAMQKGAYDLLQKPLDPNVLAIRIEKALEQRELRIERRRYVTDIEKKVVERTSELESARKAAIFGLARLTEYRDEERPGFIWKEWLIMGSFSPVY